MGHAGSCSSLKLWQRIGGAAVSWSGGVTYAWPGELLDSIQAFFIPFGFVQHVRKKISPWELRNHPVKNILDWNVGLLSTWMFYDILGSSWKHRIGIPISLATRPGTVVRPSKWWSWAVLRFTCSESVEQAAGQMLAARRDKKLWDMFE